MSREWKKNPELKRECKTCEGVGTVYLDCRDPEADCGGHGALAGHEVDCPCCDGSGGQP